MGKVSHSGQLWEEFIHFDQNIWINSKILLENIDIIVGFIIYASLSGKSLLAPFGKRLVVLCNIFTPGFLSVAVITCALHAQGRRFEPGRKHIFSFCSVSTTMSWSVNRASSPTLGFHGVMVSTLDFESSDPSSNLGGT